MSKDLVAVQQAQALAKRIYALPYDERQNRVWEQALRRWVRRLDTLYAA